MYKVDIWDYTDSPEQLNKLIDILKKNKRVVVAYDPDFPTGRGVFHFGEESDENLQECNKVVYELNMYHYGEE